MFIQFYVAGNGIDPLGNPRPKIKLTSRQHWTKSAQNYVAWKRHVVRAFFDAIAPHFGNPDIKNHVDFLAAEKPITLPDWTRSHMHVDMMLEKNAHRPDGENVFGSVADALFADDKYLSGSFTTPVNPQGAGGVGVTLIIPLHDGELLPEQNHRMDIYSSSHNLMVKPDG